ncbi:LysR family transcriptional regulator [Pseudomonas panipatensis]|uniref:DNA-binding transcriptional regulator, LysR family n=1 Tax=Pseudomonas panipatensis TaxID=428992 RepID=A0A1G8HE72_9PSED|nr:LysR family transcriptional regulator [Pseudomonas panipatensis]SDI04821.1 DNA-binding transcriptional regulator, LysR family [Pseudomonas panipatensis]SMP57691.1 DNA-binding transcriptional regulator, LysR family [Pseudomonas panipatensis]
MRSHDRYSEVLAFVAVAQRGSFIQAADDLGMTPSALSRKVQALEQRLGSRLLQRTTRRVNLTEAGALYLERGRRWLDELADADQALADLAGNVRGRLRVSLPMHFGRLHVVPALPELLARHPQLDLDLDFSDRQHDLIAEGFDCALRIARLSDSSMVARLLAENRRVLVASPDYLERAGVPQHPRELAAHSCLQFSLFREGDAWHLTRDGETCEVVVRGRIRASYGGALVEAARAGLGITLTATFIAGPALRSGELVQVLPEWRPSPMHIWMLYPSGRFLAPKVRAFSDFFAERFAGVPYWEPEFSG